MRSLLLTLMVTLAGAGNAAGQLGLVPFDVRVPKPPTPFLADGKIHLIYELRITNLGRQDRAIKQIDALVDKAVVASWSGDSLKGIALRVAEAPGGESRLIPAGRQSLVYLHVAVPAGTLARSVGHRILTTHPDSLEAAARDTLGGPLVWLEPTPVINLVSPLKGGPWLAANGPGNLSGHRRTVIPIEGLARVAQRFATDWVKLGPDGRLWKGDSTRNENWYGYKEPLVAVAPGTVVAIKDGIPENNPLSPQRAVPITLETVGGNHVILDLGGGKYAFYAHILAGTITVKLGDKVQPGQVIGQLGNSGNSDAPHLHFHVGDAPSPLGTEGLPFVIDGYEKLGVVGQNFMAGFKPAGPPEAKQGELPLQNHVVQFKP